PGVTGVFVELDRAVAPRTCNRMRTEYIDIVAEACGEAAGERCDLRPGVARPLEEIDGAEMVSVLGRTDHQRIAVETHTGAEIIVCLDIARLEHDRIFGPRAARVDGVNEHRAAIVEILGANDRSVATDRNARSHFARFESLGRQEIAAREGRKTR